MRYILIISIFITAGIIEIGFWITRDEFFIEKPSQVESKPTGNNSVISSRTLPPSHSPSFIQEERDKIKESNSVNLGKNVKSGIILLDVPFIPQAPFGNWNDSRQQNGCEEAAMLMAISWARGEASDPTKAEKEIFALTKFQEERIGHFYDTSANDTTKILKDYFRYDGVRVKNSITSNDIRSELERGNLVIVPVNGRHLGNPFYTPPGPFTHMLVIRGYDYETKEFITNDPGTKRGELFRYSEEVLSGALQDYPTGYHEPQNPEKTAMIVVEKETKTSRH